MIPLATPHLECRIIVGSRCMDELENLGQMEVRGEAETVKSLAPLG